MCKNTLEMNLTFKVKKKKKLQSVKRQFPSAAAVSASRFDLPIGDVWKMPYSSSVNLKGNRSCKEKMIDVRARLISADTDSSLLYAQI